MKPLYEILHQVESIRLATHLLEPEPVEIEAFFKNGSDKRPRNMARIDGQGANGDKWSGDASRNVGGSRTEKQHIEISIGDENADNIQKPRVSCI